MIMCDDYICCWGSRYFVIRFQTIYIATSCTFVPVVFSAEGMVARYTSLHFSVYPLFLKRGSIFLG